MTGCSGRAMRSADAGSASREPPSQRSSVPSCAIARRGGDRASLRSSGGYVSSRPTSASFQGRPPLSAHARAFPRSSCPSITSSFRARFPASVSGALAHTSRRTSSAAVATEIDQPRRRPSASSSSAGEPAACFSDSAKDAPASRGRSPASRSHPGWTCHAGAQWADVAAAMIRTRVQRTGNQVTSRLSLMVTPVSPPGPDACSR